MTYKNTPIFNELLKYCNVSAEWLKLNGYKSVEQMLNRMIDKAVEITEMSPEQLTKDCWLTRETQRRTRDALLVPVILIHATPVSQYYYGVKDEEWEWFYLPDATSDKCFDALPETDRRYLEEMAIYGMSPAEERPLYDYGDYDVIIEIDACGVVTYRPY